MSTRFCAIALLGLLAGSAQADPLVLLPTWDGIQESHSLAPDGPPIVTPNFNVTSLNLGINKQFLVEQSFYRKDVAIIAFDLRSIRDLRSFEANLVLVREDGPTVDPIFVNVFAVTDDGIGTRSDFLQTGTLVGTKPIMPRRQQQLEEQLVNFTDAVRTAISLDMDFVAFRIEESGDWRTDPHSNYIQSSEFGLFVTPRLEVFEPATLDGFYPPVDMPSIATNIAKAGRTIPLKFYAATVDGPITDLTSAILSVIGVACEGVSSASETIDSYTVGSAVTLENLGGGSYQYNWKTSKADEGTCKTVTLALPDPYKTPTSPIAIFKFSRK